MSDTTSTLYKLGKFFGKNPIYFAIFIAIIGSSAGYLFYENNKIQNKAKAYKNAIYFGLTPFDIDKNQLQLRFEKEISALLHGTVNNDLSYVPLNDNLQEKLCEFSPLFNESLNWIGVIIDLERGFKQSARFAVRLNNDIVFENTWVFDETEKYSENYNKLLNASIGDVIVFNGKFSNSSHSGKNGQCNSIGSNIYSPDTFKENRTFKAKFNLLKIKDVKNKKDWN